MRLGLVGPLPPPNGGMAMQTRQLKQLLRQEGINVTLVQTNAPYRPRVIENLKGVRALFRLLPYLWRIWRLCGNSDVIHLMANSGWSWQLFAAPVLWIGWLRGTPVIVNYRGGEARQYLESSARWVKPSMARASRLVVPSGFLQQVFSDFGIHSDIIPNIIDLETFSPAAQVPRKEGFTLAITRNLEPIYGLDTAIRAAAIASDDIPGLHLRIAGSGPQKEELLNLAVSLGIAQMVSFEGRLDREHIVALYREADAMLNPTRVDNMPNSVLEALACAVPVISTDVGGIPHIVEHGKTAVLVKPDDEEAMASAIVALYRDRELQDCLQTQGREEVARYTWDRVRPQWLSLYHYCEAAG